MRYLNRNSPYSSSVLPVEILKTIFLMSLYSRAVTKPAFCKMKGNNLYEVEGLKEVNEFLTNSHFQQIQSSQNTYSKLSSSFLQGKSFISS